MKAISTFSCPDDPRSWQNFITDSEFKSEVSVQYQVLEYFLRIHFQKFEFTSTLCNIGDCSCGTRSQQAEWETCTSLGSFWVSFFIFIYVPPLLAEEKCTCTKYFNQVIFPLFCHSGVFSLRNSSHMHYINSDTSKVVQVP